MMTHTLIKFDMSKRWARYSLRYLMAHWLMDFRYIDAETGRRSDAAHNYIYNQSHSSNITILDKSRVIRVIIQYVLPQFLFSSRSL